MAANNAGTDYDKLKDDLAAVRADLSRLTDALGDDLDQYQSSRAEAVKRNARLARDQARKAADSVSHGVSEHPFTSVFMAFGIGMLVGRMFSRQ